MRRFEIFATGCASDVLRVWEDAGFKLIDETALGNPELRLDVLLGDASRVDGPYWLLIRKLVPRVLILTGKSAQTPVFPDDIAGLFNLQVIEGEDICFYIGSSIQGQVAVPDWGAYSANKGEITGQEQIKALAGSIYRFLLQDVFRETAEWCGHMSSVVGPM